MYKRLVPKVAAICVSILTAGMVLLSALPASAATPETVGGGPTDAYSSPTPYSRLVGGYFPRTWVSMYCWVDNNKAWSYGTNRWFKVGGFGFNPYSGRITWIEGYVSANRVFNQVRVGRC
jgi:hypothetical protein